MKFTADIFTRWLGLQSDDLEEKKNEICTFHNITIHTQATAAHKRPLMVIHTRCRHV